MSDHIRHCDNCGKRATLNCVTCMRDMCGDCYHCGKAGLVCGLCLDREGERQRDWRDDAEWLEKFFEERRDY